MRRRDFYRPYDYYGDVDDYENPLLGAVVLGVLVAAALGLGVVGWWCVRLVWR